MSNSGPGFTSHPDHTITITPLEKSVFVSIDGVKVAETKGALLLKESQHPDAFYLPKNSLPSEMLIESDHITNCPFKGKASYYHLVHGGKTHENAVWSYRNPYDEALSIKGYIAIYPNVAQVTI